MLFNSYLFILIFLPLTLLSYYFIVPLLNLKNIPKHQCRLFVLLIASLIFYGYWNPKYLFLIGGSILQFGSPSWARTSDKRINSPLLYQLSYRGTASSGAHIKRFGLRGQPPDMKG